MKSNKRIEKSKNTCLSISHSSEITVGKLLRLGFHEYGKSSPTVVDLRDNSKMIVHDSFDFYYGCDICVFENAVLELGQGFMNAGGQIRCMDHISIGNHVIIGRDVLIQDGDAHSIMYDDGTSNDLTKPVIIEDHVWIGAKSIILKGVHIGSGAVIGAGALVTHDVPSNCLAVGVPAHIAKENIKWE